RHPHHDRRLPLQRHGIRRDGRQGRPFRPRRLHLHHHQRRHLHQVPGHCHQDREPLAMAEVMYTLTAKEFEDFLVSHPDQTYDRGIGSTCAIAIALCDIHDVSPEVLNEDITVEAGPYYDTRVYSGSTPGWARR